MVGTEDQVKICVIDLRLGKHEENPEEQLLGWWSYRPQTESSIMDIARLARGSIGFCSHFQSVCHRVLYVSIKFDRSCGVTHCSCAGSVKCCSLVRHIRSSHNGDAGN